MVGRGRGRNIPIKRDRSQKHSIGRRKQIAEQYAYFLFRGINNMKHFSMGTYMYECIFKHLKEYITKCM